MRIPFESTLSPPVEVQYLLIVYLSFDLPTVEEKKSPWLAKCLPVLTSHSTPFFFAMPIAFLYKLQCWERLSLFSEGVGTS